MPSYTFAELSPLDFEVLCRDLLQKEFGVTLESFKAGRDGGVDLRCFVEPCHTLIVQCKHYANSGYSKLLHELKNNEVAKIQKLKPARYILATSVALTPANKKEVHTLLSPFCLSEGDIYGRDDLNNLLGKFTDVERLNIKLWITSTTVLETIVHSQLINASTEEIEKISRRSRLYVQNPSFEEALSILDEHKFCIIAGIPGIGKTTLAEMLVLYHLRHGYELVRVTSNIQEARTLSSGIKNRLYYYDDFLGQSSDADKLAKNEDQSLLDFFETIRHSKFSRLILTTREYILNQAKLRYEKLARTPLSLETCILDLQKYSRLNKAEILFNHLYFSDLPADLKMGLLSNQGYIQIIDHPNYSPRFIDILTQLKYVVGLAPAEYLSFFLKNLRNPTALWGHAFNHQLGNAARDILIILTSMPRTVFLDDLRNAFQAYHTKRCAQHTIPVKPTDFVDGCRELEGNFVTYSKDGGVLSATFHNPSIRDFLQAYCSEASEEMIMLMQSAVFFEQLMWMSEFKLQNSSERVFTSLIESHSAEFAESLARTLNAQSCLTTASWEHVGGTLSLVPTRTEQTIESRLFTLIELANNIQSADFVSLVSSCANSVIELCLNGKANREDVVNIVEMLSDEDVRFDERQDFIDAAKRLLSSHLDDLGKFELATRCMAACEDFIGPSFSGTVRSAFKAFTEAELQGWIDGTESEDADEIRECASTVANVAEILDLDVSDSVEALNETAQVKEAMSNFDPIHSDERPSSVGSQGECTNAEITSLFETLPL